MWFLYQLLMLLALLVAGPFLLLGRGFRHLPAIPRRLGFYTALEARHPLWFHAVSVGEVGVAATLIEALPAELPLLVTTVTPTGQERAEALLGDRATIAYLPYDLGFAVRSFFRTFEPRGLVLTEGDYWPLVLRALHRRGLPATVINGRVSDVSYRRLSLARPFLGIFFGPIDRFGMQTDEDRRRLIDLGVPAVRVTTTGNLKFDTAAPVAEPGLRRWLSALAAGRPVLVAGSTMPGEEAIVLDAFTALREKVDALLLLAPRHPERWDEVDRLLRSRGVDCARRSAADSDSRPSVVLLDSLGELAALYGESRAAFVGGTLVPTGGHNPLEAARCGVPVAVGPSMGNFREIAADFDAHHAWARVADAGQLAAVWRRWLTDPDAAHRLGARGAEVVVRRRGGVARTLDLLAPLLPSPTEGTTDL